jgi:outer membrane protein assembly factor BamB
MNGIVTRPLYVEGVLVLVNSESVAGYDPGTGGRRWEIPINATIRAVGSNPGFVFVLTSSFQDSMSLMLRAISSRSGDVVWTREIPEQELFDLLLVTEESVVFVSRNPAGVTVLDAATGRVRFTVDMLPRSLYREPFLVDGDKLLVVHGNQKVELYETSTGRRVWSKILPGDAVFRGGLAVPGGILYTDSRSNLVLLDAATGEARWTIPPDENNPLQYQEEAADTDHVYLVRKRDADEVYFAEALSIRTGKVVWRTDLVTAKSATPRPLVTDRYVVYHVNSYDFTQGAWTSKTLFLDKQSGQVEQTLEPPDLQGVYTSPVLQDGIFCLSARGKIAVFGPR